MTARRYCLLLLLATFLGMVAVIAFNAYVDPYGAREWNASFRLSGFRQEQDKNERIFKLLTVARLRPQVLILGSSRAYHGIDPDHVQLKKLASSRFNAAFDGANIVEINSVIKYLAGFSSTPRTAILGLDFMSFADCGPKTDNNRVARMIEGLPSGEAGPPAQLARVLSSLDTVRASFRTLENDRAIAFHDKNGRRLERVFEDRIRERGGYAANFQKLESDFFRLYLVEQADCYYFSSDENEALKSFRDLVRISYMNRTDLRMFISPIHARQLEVIRLSGLWMQYETWLKKIVAISESEARAIGMLPFQIIDFSTFGGLNSEPVPEIHNETRAMTWYWESSHYKKTLGDLVVARLMSDEPHAFTNALPGIPLTANTMDAHLGQLQKAEWLYARDQPESLKQLMRIKCEIMKISQPCI